MVKANNYLHFPLEAANTTLMLHLGLRARNYSSRLFSPATDSHIRYGYIWQTLIFCRSLQIMQSLSESLSPRVVRLLDKCNDTDR